MANRFEYNRIIVVIYTHLTLPTNREAYSSLEFARSVLKEGHELLSIFFYREGVYNANQLTAPARDEFYLVR
ncbi:DsrE family protein, partial [Providencia thailandensis]|nr:DsrE family protein [Providencia thailandensis]